MEPLPSKIRPTSLKDFVGQAHLVGKGKPLRVAIEKKHLFPFILWGPPGSGKTTLARIYANALGAEFHELSAVDSGKEDIKTVIGKGTLSFGKAKILFIDEIHRFTKAQQDFLLPFVEHGDVTLIGATTENPSFEVISPLLSRCRVFTLTPFSQSEMEQILSRADKKLSAKAKSWLVAFSGGDARRALSALDAAGRLYGKVTPETLAEAAQSKYLRYDKKGEEHYDTISAFIKSMRGSNPDAALYYLARMVEGGEDPLFIARRMVVFASEDIGLAQPTALVVANAVFQAVEAIGFPEAAINLAHGVAYLSLAKKDRSAYEAYGQAVADVREHGNLPIPLKLRNAPTKLMRELGYGKGYETYGDKELLPEKIAKKRYLKGKSGERG